MPEIISRKDALTAGERHYFTGKPCKQGHVAVRLVSTHTCVICNKNNNQRFRDRNPDFYNDRYHEWVERDPEAREIVAERDRKKQTSEIQSLMRISYDVFCLKKK